MKLFFLISDEEDQEDVDNDENENFTVIIKQMNAFSLEKSPNKVFRILKLKFAD